jgi:salicylate hydroxylase
MKIVIAGAGIGGLTAAMCLHRAGFDVEVFEAVSELRPLGVGINIQAGAVRILSALGLEPALAATAIETRELRYANRHGQTIWADPRGRHAGLPWPQFSIHRGELQMILFNAAKEMLGADRIKFGRRIARFAQHHGKVAAHFVDRDGMPVENAEADILIGADGIHSTVRGQMFGKELPRYTGNVAWRGLVPAERVAHLDVAKVTGVWMGPNRSIVQYYVAAGRTFNWIGISRSEQPARESWLAEGRVEDALAEYSGWHDIIRTIIKETPKLLRQALYDREPLPDWRVGRVALLGDAAHPMMPFYAQGAAQSIEDAYVLAGCLAARQDDPVAALARYVQLRQPRTAWMQGLSRREEELYQMNDAATIAERNARMRTNRTPESANFPPEQERLYGYDAEAVLRA